MNFNWNLDTLYTGFDTEAFQKDFDYLHSSPQKLNEFCDENFNNHTNAVKKIEKFIALFQKIKTTYSRMYAFASLSFSTNTKDPEALKFIEKLDKINTEFTKPLLKFQQWVYTIENLSQCIEKSDILKEHEFYLNQLIEEFKHRLSEKEEVLISKLQQTGSNSWETLQDQITSSIKVDIEIDGEQQTLPLSELRNLAYDHNPDVRKKAYDLELKSYEDFDISSVSALNSIKGEVLTLANLRNFNSPLHESLFKSRMTKDSLEAMIEAIEESLPKFRNYLKTKAQLLGHDNNQLPFYDLFAPIGSIDKKYTYDEAKEIIVNKFGTFSDELSDFAKNAIEKRWIDVKPKEGKRGGAFCYNLPSIDESRILTNFTGNFNDILTLSHELGHAFHGHNLSDESILNSDYPMPVAETASIFCETIVKNALIEEADATEAFIILESNIQGYTQIIVDIYTRFIFESNFFETRKDHGLSIDETKELMIDAQKKAYGFGLDENYLHPYMWMCKPHYYSADFNYYNYPYAFGLLFALGLYNIYKKDKEQFINKYNTLLAQTGKAKVKDIADLMAIDITDTNFWKNSLKEVTMYIDEFIKLADEQ